MEIESTPSALPKYNLFDSVLEMKRLPEETIVHGAGTQGFEVLHRWRGIDIGVHVFDIGEVFYEDTDQVFVALEGSATVTWPDGATLEVGPGDVVALEEKGLMLKWTVHQPLKKVYLYAPESWPPTADN